MRDAKSGNHFSKADAATLTMLAEKSASDAVAEVVLGRRGLRIVATRGHRALVATGLTKQIEAVYVFEQVPGMKLSGDRLALIAMHLNHRQSGLETKASQFANPLALGDGGVRPATAQLPVADVGSESSARIVRKTHVARLMTARIKQHVDVEHGCDPLRGAFDWNRCDTSGTAGPTRPTNCALSRDLDRHGEVDADALPPLAIDHALNGDSIEVVLFAERRNALALLVEPGSEVGPSQCDSALCHAEDNAK